MTEQKLILIVDDEPFNQEILEEILEDDYRLIFADNGQECIEQVKIHSPSLILLDVNMPIMTGLEACKMIKDMPEHSNIPIIFVSALASPEQRIAGYTAGGDDYVTKPFSKDILLSKIELLLTCQDEFESLQSNLKDTQSALQTSFTSTSELSDIVLFLRGSSKSHSVEEIIKSVFSVLKGLDLEACLYIKDVNSNGKYYFSDGKASDSDISIIEIHKEKERIISIGNQSVFNMQTGTLLIRNMPDDDEVRGRYRDHFTVLVDGMNAQIQGKFFKEKVLTKREKLINLVSSTRVSLKKVDLLSKEIRIKHAKILSDMGQEIEELFMNLGLTELQEVAIMSLIEKNETDTEALYEEGVITDAQFNEVVNQLNISLN